MTCRSASFGAVSHSCVLNITGQCRRSLITRAALMLTDYRLGWGPRSGHTTYFCCKWQWVLWKWGCSGRGERSQSLRRVRSRFVRSALGENHFGATTVTRRSGSVGGWGVGELERCKPYVNKQFEILKNGKQRHKSLCSTPTHKN